MLNVTSEYSLIESQIYLFWANWTLVTLKMLDPLYEGLKEPSSENLQAPYYVHRKKISNDTFRKSFEVTLRCGEKILSQQKK